MNNWLFDRHYTVRTYFTLSDTIPGGNDKSAYWAKQLHQNFGQFFGPGLESAAEELNTPELTKLLQEHIYPRYYHEAYFYMDDYIDQVETPYQTSDAYKEVCGRIYSWALSTQQTYGELVKLYEEQKQHLLDDIKTVTTNTGTVTNVNNNTATHDLNVHNNNTMTNNSDSTASSKANVVPQIITTAESDEYVNNLGSTTGHNEGKDTNVGDTLTTGTVKNEGGATNTNNLTATTTTNVDTMINRLDEINQKLIDIYDVWSNDFGKNFIIW